MLFKPEWHEARERLSAYWRRENDGRCLLGVTAHQGENVPYPAWPSREDEDLQRFWLDAEAIIARYRHYFEHTYFGAEAVPWLDVRLGPGITAAYLGAKVHLAPRTVWFAPVLEGWRGEPFVLDEENYWWRKTREITEKAADAGNGKFLVGITDLSGIADIQAHLRGSERLCLDFVDCADRVKIKRDEILEIWFHCFRRLCDLTQGHQEGHLDWLGIWSAAPYKTLQCDLSAMISPRMFEEFILPELQEQCRQIPHTLYHLDGPAATRHLDLLLGIPELTGIQWQPGAGQPRAIGWLPMLERVQQAGKNLYLHGLAEDVRGLLGELSPRGLYIKIDEPFRCPAEADDFVRWVEAECRR